MLKVGDVVLAPTGEQAVVEVDLMRDMFLTESPGGVLVEWPMRELEELPFPEPGDLAAVDQWLRCVARVIPAPVVTTETVQCSEICDCRHCYRFEQVVDGVPAAHHMTNNAVCACVTRRCSCTFQHPQQARLGMGFPAR